MAQRGEWVVRSAGNASRSLRACVGAAWGSGSVRGGRVAVRGWEQIFDGKCVVRSAGVHRCCEGNASALCGGGSAREGRVAVRGREKVFGGEWVVRAAGVHRRCEGGAEVCGKGASLCGGGSRSSAGNGW